ncbi:MAG: Ldh family oxidoreductase, partial [Pseudomonadota bacterium]
MAQDTVRLTLAEAEALIAAALTAHNVSDAAAGATARALVAAEADGQKGHGFSRVASYAAQAASGKAAGRATPTAEQAAPAFLRIDAAHGFAYPALDLAVERLAELAPRTGLAGASIIRSHHCGQLGATVERLAERGLVALMVANTPKAMAPWGGDAPLFGTNPIAFAAPMDDAPPLVIDLSLSKVARGKVMAAAKAGEAIPEGWALDADGVPTTDPHAALKGAMIPAGDAKGAALALIVEVLAASLTGASPSYEATSFFDADGAPPGVGQLILAFQADDILGAAFAPRMSALAAEITAQEGARLPGSRRLALRAEARANGLAVAAG